MTQVLRSGAALRAQVKAWQSQGARIGLVPTMGALHHGHLHLAHRARAENTRVIATIFVNPRQFNNTQDLAKYPRHEAHDIAMLSAVPVDAIFIPDAAEVYPPHHTTSIDVGPITATLEGAMRPGHFQGVATIVAKLFALSQADSAYFGEKDWQQLQVIRKMVLDLDMPITIMGCETQREASGLAMSSRNERLSAKGRVIAADLYTILSKIAHNIANTGHLDIAAPDQATQKLLAAGFEKVEYLGLYNAHTLAPIYDTQEPARLLAAVQLENIRLIDNLAIPRV